jgi:hypothetical protein
MTCLYGVADHYMPYQAIKDRKPGYLKSEGRMPVGVRVPPPAPTILLIQQHIIGA